MSTISTTTTMTTGFKSPTKVAQYYEYGKVNTQTCYAYSELDNIKKADGLCAYTPSGGGINDTHASPRVYTYGYDFNIPSNATITKILVRQRRGLREPSNTDSTIKDSLIALKTGASTSDTGTGNNLSKGTLWPAKKTVSTYDAGNRELSVKELWGVDVTPEMANNKDFGSVVQCTGTSTTWHRAHLYSVQMNIYYTVPASSTTEVVSSNDSTTSTTKTTEIQQSNYVFSTPDEYYLPDGATTKKEIMLNSIPVDQIYTPFQFYIHYTNIVVKSGGVEQILEGYHKPIKIQLNECLEFQDHTQTLTLPDKKMESRTDKNDIKRGYYSKFKQIRAYPKKMGTGKITITGLRYYDTNDQLKTTATLTVKVTDSYNHMWQSKCSINNCHFNDNTAYTKGQSIYNGGRLEYTNLDYKKGNNELYDYDKYRDE